MSASSCRVYNIAPGGDFLQVLAREILLGFPFAQSNRENPPLPNWTILLPTRRAARILGSILAKNSGQRTLLLPTIKPIGDIDDGRLQDDGSAADIPLAISRTGQVLLMLDILKNWASKNPQTKIAAEIQASQIQSLSLANSLLQLVEQIEVSETDLEQLSEVYNLELSEHRTALVNLLGLLKIELPQKLLQENVMGPAARRSLLIRLEANRITNLKLRGPIIAAGSTGTIPATRALLNAIAHHHQGAVVLPGLDLGMSADDWSSLGPDHPQFSLQNTISDLKIERSEIVSLSIGNSHRNFLSAELMRPSSTAEQWHTVLKDRTEDMRKALDRLHVVKAPDRHIEASAIALILRFALETPHKTAALVTPDRDLAQRVKAELLRWDIVIDDSAGEPLHHHGITGLANTLLQSISSGLSSADLLAVLSHPDVTFGMNRVLFLKHLTNFEIAVLRSYGNENGLTAIRNSFERALEAKRTNARAHPLVSALTDDDWLAQQKFVQTFIDILAPLFEKTILTGEECLTHFENTLNKLAPQVDWTLGANQDFKSLLDELQYEAKRLANSCFADVAPIILHLLREKTLQSARVTHPRLAIYGVLEARLVPCDIVVLGGLNEGRWPSQPDPGPWLNRPMRMLFGIPLPERDIGVSAHDFMQNLGYAEVFLTYSQRLEGAPQIPSRWLLRLQTVIQASGISAESIEANSWVELAQTLDASYVQMPQSKPKPNPDVSKRPTQFSVTEVEKLIRDPYTIYVRKILRIEPLQNLAREPDAALRGTLFHEALKLWNQQQEFSLSADAHSLLLQVGAKLFEPLRNNAEISTFWWSRFKRIAEWIATEEPNFRQSLTRVQAELSGYCEFDIAATTYKLTAKADRIDILKDGSARIIDYKSGIPPSAKAVRSGISPQLPLEAAILLLKGFPNLYSKSVAEMMYIHMTGADPAGEVNDISAEDQTLDAMALAQLEGFKALLSKYQNPAQPYYPRAAVQKEDDVTDFDLLSRYKEWMLAGDT